MKSEKGRRAISLTVYLLLVPACVALGANVFRDRAYIWISVCLAVLSCVPFFARFENRPDDTRRMAVLAAMTALSVLGRFLFYAVPHFKPVTAMVVICGIYLGAESGFLCGALTAILSNILFGQGPWTPWQMLGFGLVGFLGGVLFAGRKVRLVPLLLYGFFSVLIVYGVLLDTASMLMYNAVPSWQLWLATCASGFVFNLIHAGATAVFLLLLYQPLLRKLARVKEKYGLLE